MLQSHVNPPERGPQFSPQVSEGSGSPTTSGNDNCASGLRHYFTRASIWSSRAHRRYAAYDVRCHALVDTISGLALLGRGGEGEEHDDLVGLHGPFYVPRRGSSRPFPPRWALIRPLEIWVNFKRDVFYFSSADFPSAPPVRRRLQDALLRAASQLVHSRDRLVMIDEPWMWLDRIEKVALHAPAAEGPAHGYRLTATDRTLAITMPGLRRIYLVVPRDPSCYHGPHRHWQNVPLNEDGFLRFDHFVAMHTALQNSALGGRPCRCCLDPDPTAGAPAHLDQLLVYRDEMPEIIVVIEDILR